MKVPVLLKILEYAQIIDSAQAEHLSAEAAQSDEPLESMLIRKGIVRPAELPALRLALSKFQAELT